MTPKTDSGSLAPEATTSSQIGQSGSKQHFDTFETQFFQQGDAESVGIAAEVERFDDLDEAAKHKKVAPSRRFMMGVGLGSICFAIIGCLALWRSNANSRTAISVAVEPPAQADPALANPAAVAAPAQAEPAPAPAPTPAVPAVAEALARPVPSAAPPTALPTLAQPAPTEAEKPSPAVAAPAPAKPEIVAEDKPLPVAPAVAADAADARIRCEKAISGKRNKEILVVCKDAFAADSSAADIAVALAKIEYDRGRIAQASEWGKKALAADPNAADAYVFIGGAEQSAGHRKAAKEAYKRYLQLAPGGRYAADLRAIVSSL